MSGDFIDTNVFVYLFDEIDQRKRDIADQVFKNGLDTHTARISYQVVQETLNVLTRKLLASLTADNAQRFLMQVLRPLWQVMPSFALYEHGLEIQGRYGFSFYDAMIIAAALKSGSNRLLSEDLQHGQLIEGLWVENPFLY